MNLIHFVDDCFNDLMNCAECGTGSGLELEAHLHKVVNTWRAGIRRLENVSVLDVRHNFLMGHSIVWLESI